MSRRAIVHIVDDEPQVGRALANLLAAAGYEARCHPSADEFCESYDPSVPGCVIVDVCLPGMNGLALQEKLAGTDTCIPAIILTGHADVPMAVEAMAKGAVGFLQKPPRSHELLALVATSVESHRSHLENVARFAEHRERLQLLTDRERDILRLVVDGEASKDIADQFGISLRTVEQHRSHAMHKLQLNSIAELVRFWMEAHGPPPGTPFRDVLKTRPVE